MQIIFNDTFEKILNNQMYLIPFFIPSFSISDVVCGPTDLIWR